MSILESIYNAKPIQPSGQQWMFRQDDPQEKGMGKSIPDPADDPFHKAAEVPRPEVIKPSTWLSSLYANLLARLDKGSELYDQTTDEATRATYMARLVQLTWQIHLVELVAKEHVPCPPSICPNRVGGGFYHPKLRDRYLQELKEAQAAGLVAIPIQTSGGRTYRIVATKSTPAVPGELDPLDMAALARVAHMAGCDELTLLDRLEVTPCAPSSP